MFNESFAATSLSLSLLKKKKSQQYDAANVNIIDITLLESGTYRLRKNIFGFTYLIQ